MENIKKFKYLLIFVLIISSILITSCSKSQNANTPLNPSDASVPINTDATPTETSIFDVLPQNNYNGDTFTMYIPPNPDSPVDKGTYAESLTGEVFNDAVYNRNLEVESQYNVKINEVFGASWDSTYGDMKKDVASGSLRADVYFTHVMSGVASIVSDGLVRQWTDVPHLDFTQPWWNQTIIKNLNIANKTFYISGSMSIQDAILLVFNKTLLQNLALENPYQLVRDGKWTLDKLNEMATAGSKDLNGDGKITEQDDQFGLEYGIQWQTPALMYACDEVSVTLDQNGYPTVQLDNQRKIDAYQKIYDLLWDGNKTYCFLGNTTQLSNYPHIGIESGRDLFCEYNLFTCESLRSTDVDYGILPLPKYDENQEKYLSNSWTGMYCLPVNIPDEKLDMLGTVMESMSALGYKNVIPVYYDILLKEKVSRDDDSREMLDIILNGMVYDLGLNFQVGSTNPPGFFITDLIKNKNPDYVSAVDKVKDKMASDYDGLYQKILTAGS
ncbi:MAG: hypothetical protein FWD71_11175 [Oscillospiraceae bacterium]|nr:hypothetical protein [Oscillospiraceae bacterium]